MLMRAITGYSGSVRRPRSANEVNHPSRSKKLDEPMPWPAEYFTDPTGRSCSPITSAGQGGGRGKRVGVWKPVV